MTELRDEAVADAEQHKRKAVLLQEELREKKIRLSRVTQEKMKLQRDSRSAATLAKSLDSHHHMSDLDYYKRKVSELSGQVQGQNAVIAEKGRQIKELERQLERNMSQNRLATLRRNKNM
jgi:hypothetical protein